MKNQKYTIADVAKRMRVSPSTISRVLNNRPGVGPVLRQKITIAINELDYKPNILARSFTLGSIKIIGLILGDIRNPFYADLAFYLQKFLNDAGYMLVPYNSEYKTDKEVEYIKQCGQFNFAGLLLIADQSKAVFNAIQEAGMPVVLINRTLQNYTGDIVSIDNFQAGYIATRYLVELGHQSVAFISGNMFLSAIAQRFQGYRQFLKNNQIPFFERYVFHGDFSMQSGYEIAKTYGLNIRSLPSAAVVSNDLMALGFIDGLQEQGVKVPEMVSVISVDNISFSALQSINLTTVDQQVEEMSKQAYRLILRRIENPDAQTERITLEPRLIIRGTTSRYNHQQ
jgi:DNA-binding LacI/PurR family transcriptional regulator